MTERIDVIIVGAGCAGTTLAVLLARQGFRVVVLERGQNLKDTRSTHMFEADALAFLDRLGLTERLRATGAPLIGHADMRVADVHVQIDLPQRPGDIGAIASVRRRTLDPLLAQAAVEAGADVRMKATVTDLLMEGGRVIGVRFREGKRTREMRARLVVGADGCHSKVAARVRAGVYKNLTRKNQRMVCWGYYEGAQPSPQPTLLSHRIDDRLFGAMPTDGGLYQVVALPGLNEYEHFCADRNAAFDRHVRAYEPIADILANAHRVEDARYISKWTGFFREACGRGWVLIGDAGHFKSPAAGRGMGDAFMQVESLAVCLATALTGTDEVLDRALRLWGRRRDREFVAQCSARSVESALASCGAAG